MLSRVCRVVSSHAVPAAFSTLVSSNVPAVSGSTRSSSPNSSISAWNIALGVSVFAAAASNSLSEKRHTQCTPLTNSVASFNNDIVLWNDSVNISQGEVEQVNGDDDEPFGRDNDQGSFDTMSLPPILQAHLDNKTYAASSVVLTRVGGVDDAANRGLYQVTHYRPQDDNGRGDGNIPGTTPLAYPSFRGASSPTRLGGTIIEPVCKTITQPNRIIDNNRKRKRQHEYNDDELLLLDRMNVDSFDNVHDYEMSHLKSLKDQMSLLKSLKERGLPYTMKRFAMQRECKAFLAQTLGPEASNYLSQLMYDPEYEFPPSFDWDFSGNPNFQIFLEFDEYYPDLLDIDEFKVAAVQSSSSSSSSLLSTLVEVTSGESPQALDHTEVGQLTIVGRAAAEKDWNAEIDFALPEWSPPPSTRPLLLEAEIEDRTLMVRVTPEPVLEATIRVVKSDLELEAAVDDKHIVCSVTFGKEDDDSCILQRHDTSGHSPEYYETRNVFIDTFRRILEALIKRNPAVKTLCKDLLRSDDGTIVVDSHPTHENSANVRDSGGKCTALVGHYASDCQGIEGVTTEDGEATCLTFDQYLAAARTIDSTYTLLRLTYTDDLAPIKFPFVNAKGQPFSAMRDVFAYFTVDEWTELISARCHHYCRNFIDMMELGCTDFRFVLYGDGKYLRPLFEEAFRRAKVYVCTNCNELATLLEEVELETMNVPHWSSVIHPQTPGTMKRMDDGVTFLLVDDKEPPCTYFQEGDFAYLHFDKGTGRNCSHRGE
jgi:hypothetical protein